MPLPFQQELWALAQASHDSWSSARLPPGCAFYNLHGAGISTPYDVQYGSWWLPVSVSWWPPIGAGGGRRWLARRWLGPLLLCRPASSAGLVNSPSRPPCSCALILTRTPMPMRPSPTRPTSPNPPPPLLPPPQDLEAVPRANASFTYIDGDGTVPTESATAHNLEPTASAALKADHRGLVASQVGLMHACMSGWVGVRLGACWNLYEQIAAMAPSTRQVAGHAQSREAD